MKYPILMADIINSNQKKATPLINQFKETVSAINYKWSQKIISPLTITLGDEFQGITHSVKTGIQIIFDIEEFILSQGFDFKLRYVLEFGEIATPINKKIAYEMLGEGLTNARKQLNSLKNEENRFLIRLNNSDDMIQNTLNDSFKLYQYFIDSWNLKDYQLAYQFLINTDYKEIAKNLNLNNSTTWRREKSLHIEEYKKAKDIILNLTILNDSI